MYQGGPHYPDDLPAALLLLTQELCQDVFIQAMKKIRQLREPEAFAGWLRSITNRMAINRLVRKPADRAIESETLDYACVETRTPLVEALADERRREVRKGLKQLRRLDHALRHATARAWHVLELALAGESFWQRCRGLLAGVCQWG